jgi:MoaA/NifB/PqqE/SkfB family radical SAM enzyme
MYLKWNLTKKCTLDCKFCHNALERKNWSRDINIQQMDQIIENISNTKNLDGVTLLGGDPLEFQHILQLADRLNAHNVPFGFITAGEEIYTGKYDSILLNQSLKFIGLSIDSLNSQTVSFVRNKDMLKKQLDSLDHILYLKKIHSLNYSIFTNTILMNVNRNEIIDLVKYFKQKKIDKIQILEYKHSQKATHDFTVNFEEEMSLLSDLSLYIKENTSDDFSMLELCFLPEPGKDYLRKIASNNNISIGTSSTCPIFRETIFISNDGFVYPCDNYKPYFKYSSITKQPEKIYKIENLLENDLNEVVKNNEYFKDLNELVKKPEGGLFSNLEPCNKCRYLLKKCFPCLQYSKSHETQSYVYDEKCKHYMEICQ